MRSSDRRIVALALMLACAAPAIHAATDAAKDAYAAARVREDVLRRDLDSQPAGSTASALLLERLRTVVAEYETLSRRFPRSGYSDNALWQAAVLAADAFWTFGEERDRSEALRLFAALASRFPSSPLVKQVGSHTRRLSAAPKAAPEPAPPVAGLTLLKSIRRDTLRDALRITLELEREAIFHDERLDGPPRVFIDLQDTRPAAELKDRTIGFQDDVVKQIRVGRHGGATTRVVLDLQGVARHSVYALYDPYRVVIDFERDPAAGAASVSVAPSAGESARGGRGTPAGDVPGATWTPAPGAPSTPPAPPSANAQGGFSLSRQLGLGISRVVIDAGHGGHDPGARVKGLNEADLVLDVALRLEQLLLKQPEVEVVMTRRHNVYIPLEARTAIANRSGADLFLSIHANASSNLKARGVETYFLNFAANPEAEAVAARENAGSSKTMHNLPDIVKAIALNNKLDESRDFALHIQSSMYDRLRRSNREVKNLGVKQAPFMVLIGATMPSVLAEISFVTNRQEAALLKRPAYRHQIAEALLTGITRYQKALKATQTVAAQ